MPSIFASAARLSLAVLASAVVVPACAQTAARGITANITMTLEPPSMGGSSPGATSFTGTALFAPGKGRIDITRGGGPAMDFRAGDYVLLPDSARVVYLRPASQEFWNMDSPFLNPFAQLAAGAGQLTASGGNVTMERLGDGDTVSTVATRKYRINAEYSIGAGALTIPAGVTLDITVARTPLKYVAAPIAGAQTFGMPTSPGMMARIGAYLAEIGADGIVVRARSTTWFSPNNTSVTMVISTELTDLRETDVDQAKLAMPTGYKAGGG